MQGDRKIKAVRTDQEIECPFLDESLRANGVELVLLPGSISEDQLIEEVREAELLLMCYTPITSRVINAAQKLKGIVKFGVGIDAINIDAAKARQIPVVNVPEYAEETVAEGAFAMLIALAKKLIPIHDAMETQGWVWPTQKWIGSDIAGKTLGIVGVGRIGRSLARMAGAGFRARVVGYDPNVSQEEMRAVGVQKYESLQEMLAECDFVSVHCVLTDNSHELIGEAEFRSMKSTAVFINSARGAVVDENALLQALKTKQIAGAGLDVFTHEPLDKDSHALRDLYGMDNVIVMPHLTFYTQESVDRLEQETLERCSEVLAGKSVVIRSRDDRLTSQSHGVVIQN